MRVVRQQRAQSGPLALVGLLLAAILIGAGPVSVAAADDGRDIGTGLSVEVIESSASPTPSSTRSTAGGGGGGTNNGTAAGVQTTGTTGPSSSTTTSVTTGSSVDGVLYVSGLSWSYAPSLNPLDGSLNLRFTVRNVYHETLSPTATLWINQIFGGPVDVPVIIVVDKLNAGETRTVEASFHGLAQWTMLSAHATLAIPSKGELTLAPIGRDAVIWFLPWFVVLLAAAAAGWILWRRLRPRGDVSAGTDLAGQEGDPAAQVTDPGAEGAETS